MDEIEINNAVYGFEDQDRWVTSAYLRDTFKGIEIKYTPIKCAVDLECNYNGDRFNIEIKKREKNNYILNKYPYAELRLDKFDGMVDYSGDIPVYYFVLLNEKWLYGYVLKEDSTWDDSFKYIWTINQTQVDKDSKKVEKEIYEIPYYNAQFKEHIGKYYQMYNNIRDGNNL